MAALSLIVDVRTYGRTYRRTFLPGLLGHLRGDDLKILILKMSFCASNETVCYVDSHAVALVNFACKI